jgi:hypothetical protein
LGQWSESMEAVTNFKLPWRLLKEKLAKANSNNEILYASTLEMIDSDDIVSSFDLKSKVNAVKFKKKIIRRKSHQMTSS